MPARNHEPRRRRRRARPRRDGVARIGQAGATFLVVIADCLRGGGCCLAAGAILDEFLRKNPLAERPWMDGLEYWEMAGAWPRAHWTQPSPFLFAPFILCSGRDSHLRGSLPRVYGVQVVLHMATAILLGYLLRHALREREPGCWRPHYSCCSSSRRREYAHRRRYAPDLPHDACSGAGWAVLE